MIKKQILTLGIAAIMLLSLVGVAVAVMTPTRDMPAQVVRGQDFDVFVTFTTDEDVTNSIGLADNADNTAGMTATVDKTWCTPNADWAANEEVYRANYIWFGPYASGESFVAKYSVHVPVDTTPGTYTFAGTLEYYVSSTQYLVDVEGNMEIEVVGAPAGVVINEFVAQPNITQTSEWIELYNPNDFAVPLDGWTIEDGTGSTYGTGSGDTSLNGKTVPANGYLVLNKSEGDFGFVLNDLGDIIILKNGTTEVDRVAYGSFDDGNTADNAPKPGEDNSTGRYPNGEDTDVDVDDFEVFTSPTAGESNGVPDTTAPEITNLQPADGSFINDAKPTISANYNDPSGINESSVEMRVDGGIVDPDSCSETGVSYTPADDLDEGLHTVTVNVSDDSPNANTNSTSWSFTVDTILPTIEFIEPTPDDNEEVNVNYVNVSVNVTDPTPSSGIDNMTVKLVWDGAEEPEPMTVYMYAFSEGKYYCEMTGLPNAEYTYWVQANDTAGNMNVSETRVVRVNVTASIFDYYRSLGEDPDKVETTDLLKAADDWREDVIPPGFTEPITTTQLLQLADEWRMAE